MLCCDVLFRDATLRSDAVLWRDAVLAVLSQLLCAEVTVEFPRMFCLKCWRLHTSAKTAAGREILAKMAMQVRELFPSLSFNNEADESYGGGRMWWWWSGDDGDGVDKVGGTKRRPEMRRRKKEEDRENRFCSTLTLWRLDSTFQTKNAYGPHTTLLDLTVDGDWNEDQSQSSAAGAGGILMQLCRCCCLEVNLILWPKGVLFARVTHYFFKVQAVCSAVNWRHESKRWRGSSGTALRLIWLELIMRLTRLLTMSNRWDYERCGFWDC